MRVKETAILFLTVLAVLFTFSASFGADRTLEISAEADKHQVRIGDRIELDVTTRRIKGVEVSFPEEPEKLGEFSFLESKSIKKGLGSSVIGKAYILSIFTTGTHVIPPVEVKYREEGQDTWQTALSPQVPVEVTSVLSGEETDIRDLKALAALGSTLVFIIIGILIASALAGIVYFFYRMWLLKEEAARRRATSPYDIAHERLMDLKRKDLPGKGLVQEYYTTLSDIVRQYLEGRFSLRAPEMTTEEFLDSIRNSPELESEHKELLRQFLSHCDMVKFARYGPTPLEMVDVFTSADHLVEQTRLIVEEEEEEVAKV
ncbi:hypothetical protein ACFL4E_00370 [Candidatus Omnitrophota bacterium]